MPKSAYKLIQGLLSILVTLTILAGCNFPGLNSPSSTYPQEHPSAELQQTQVTFNVSLPEPLTAGDSIYLILLDEVTGLSFNPHEYIMQAEDALTYSVTLPFTIGKVLKYRYSRQGSTNVDEHLYNDRPVRYRLYDVEGPATVNDVISRWTDTKFQGPTGRIMGNVVDYKTGKPISNLLVTAGGEQAFTLADGSFLLEGLPPGTHNLVFYALDGSYQIYQQGAVVAANSTTPVVVELNPTRLVTVIFTISVPADTPSGAQLRLAGSLYQLGNTFADLSGGVSALASHMPVMGKLPDGRYILTLSLPAGTYIEYKYTLGDGLWSSEVTSDGSIRLRQLLVPNAATEENDVVDAWLSPGTTPIRFDVSVPATTPKADVVSIQFNPGFGWLEPMPMRQIIGSQNTPQWRFDLTGPFNAQASLSYRYCRQDQCGAADDSATIGVNPVGRVMNPSSNPGVITDSVSSWAWMSALDQPATVPDIQVTSRAENFIAGLEFSATYHPSYQPLLSDIIQQVPALGVNWLVLSPSWTFTNNTPPILEPLPSEDMLEPQLVSAITAAELNHLSVGLFPQPNFPYDLEEWWQIAARDFPWWVSFFERYSNFILHHAAIASSTNTGVLIMGGEWLDPALPAGALADGTPSNVPEDAEKRWRELLSQVRSRYSGKLAWAISYPDGIKNPPPFLDAFDELYILWSAPLASQPGTPLEQMQVQADTILDQEILPFQQQVGKPILLAISYPSIDQAVTGCIDISGGQCLSYDILALPNPDIPQLNLNLNEQANAYNAMLSAINDRPWISGYVSMGYYPPALLQDKSTSIHGKPASGVLLFWSQQYLGK